MPVHVFTIVLDRDPTDAEFDALFEATGDDPGIGNERGVPIVHFNRSAQTLADALVSAVRDIESVGLKAMRVRDDDLLTLADIADRVGRSRESVRRYATGERGGGGFPPPVNPEHEGTLFYRWSEVSLWLRERLGIEVDDTDRVLVVANLLLQARQHRDHVEHLSTLAELLA
jgi:hypothetical protein